MLHENLEAYNLFMEESEMAGPLFGGFTMGVVGGVKGEGGALVLVLLELQPVI
jgi:hypothetical protein